MKIAICDDDKMYIEQICEMVKSFLKENKKVAEIAAFTNPEELLTSVQKNVVYDLFILDVEMPQMNGLRLANAIRQSMRHPVIIFLTSHRGYAIEAYQVEPIRYVPKGDVDEALEEALRKAFEEVEKQSQQFVTITSYNRSHRLFYDELLYVRRVLRKIEIATKTEGIISMYKGIKDLFSEIDDPRFVFIDKGCFVNLDYVRQIDKSNAIMIDGTTLQISRQFLPKVKSYINRVWGETAL